MIEYQKPDPSDAPTRVMKNRLTRWVLFFVVLLVVWILVQIFKVSVTEADKWQELANSQQVRSTVTPASRGTIYDTNGQVLAQSATVYNVYVDPVMLWGDYLNKRDERIKALTELIAEEDDKDKRAEYQQKLNDTKPTQQSFDELVEFLSAELKVEPEQVRKYCLNKESQYEIIKKNVEKAVAVRIEDYLTEENLDGVRCEPTNKRFYPQGSLASSVIGHMDHKNIGVIGVEAYYDDYLRGIDGRVITATARDGTEIPYRYRQSYDAQDGDSLVLNLDLNIQYQLEKALDRAVEKSKPLDRACGIIMDPNTGAIYAMATNYSYDPNNPSDLTDDEVAAKLAALDEDSKEFINTRIDAWNKQWKNKAVSEIYFPGSVFKIITGSAALEEQAITLEDTFSCNTQIKVADTTIHCWSTYKDHGSQNLYDAMTHSCNPAFVQIGQRLGIENFCKYLKAFGLSEKTGIDLPAEATSITYNASTMGIVDLASSSFGQANKLTPIQVMTACAAAINGGYLLTPQVVDKIVDSKGNVLTDNEPVVKRQVISSDVSATMRDILENVVNSEPNTNAYVKGFRIGGKSGTSQKLDENPSGTTHVASYFAFAPADDPQVAMLIMIDDPQGEEFYGSELAAPVCREILSEILPYMGYFPQYTDAELEDLQVEIPSLGFTPVENAKKTIDEMGLKYSVRGNGDTVLKQVPSSGSAEKGSTIILYTEEGFEEKLVTVPNLNGLTKEQAKTALTDIGLNLSSKDAASSTDEEKELKAQTDQNYAPQTVVPEGTVISVTFGE